MRWRTVDEVKAGKGEKICANVKCGQVKELQPMEVIFGYVEVGKRKSVLVKCVTCGRCKRKMRKAQGNDQERRSGGRLEGDGENGTKRRHRHRHKRPDRRSSLRGEEEQIS